MQKNNKKCKKLTKNAKKTINQQKASEIFRLLIFRRLLFLNHFKFNQAKQMF